MKLKLTGALATTLFMILEYLKIDVPEEPEDEVIIPVPVAGEPPPTTPTPTPSQAGIIEQIIEHTYPSPIVIISDEEEQRETERISTTTTTTAPTTIKRTIHRQIE